MRELLWRSPFFLPRFEMGAGAGLVYAEAVNLITCESFF